MRRSMKRHCKEVEERLQAHEDDPPYEVLCLVEGEGKVPTPEPG